MGKIKIQCEAIARHSVKDVDVRDTLLNVKTYALYYHKASKSWNHKTRKYMGLYRNNRIDIQSKINMLKNLKF